MPKHDPLEELHRQQKEQYEAGRRAGFQEAVAMGHAALDHLEALRRDYGLEPTAIMVGANEPRDTVSFHGSPPREKATPAGESQGAKTSPEGANPWQEANIQRDPLVSEREGGCDSMLWGGQLWKVDHKTEADRDPSADYLSGDN